MSTFPATEREYVIANLVRRYPITAPSPYSTAQVEVAIRDRMESEGCSAWTELAPRNTPEFWGDDGRVHQKWLEWPYHFRYASNARGVYIGSLYPKRPPEITWRDLAEAMIAATLPPVPVQASLFDALEVAA